MNIDRRVFARIFFHLTHTTIWGWSLQGCEYESWEDQQPLVNLTSLEGGERLFSSDTQLIEWDFSNISNIDIEFTMDAGRSWDVLFPSLRANEGQIEWDIPDITSDQCQIRIKDSFSGNMLVESGLFSIEKVRLGIKVSEYPVFESADGVKNFGSITIRRAFENTFIVLNNRCTHQFCRVDWLGDQNLFECPCHFSQFSRSGKVLAGPAEEPLQKYPYKYFPDTDRLYVF